RHARAGQRDGDLVTGSEVLRADEYLHLALRADVDLRATELLRLRDVLDLEDVSDEDPGHAGSEAFDLVDRRAGHREPDGELFRRHVDVDELTQPRPRDPHEDSRFAPLRGVIAPA